MDVQEATEILENLAFQRENNAVVSLDLNDCRAIRLLLLNKRPPLQSGCEEPLAPPPESRPMPSLEDMSDLEYLKWLMVDLVDNRGYQQGSYVLNRLLGLVGHLEAEDLVPEDDPQALPPDMLRDRLIDIVFKGYIGVSASKQKASKVVDRILFTLTAFYEKQERDELSRIADKQS